MKGFECILHIPKEFIKDSDNGYDGTMFWKVEETAWTKHRELWGWQSPCVICGADANSFSAVGGYRCNLHGASGVGMNDPPF